MMWLLSPPYSHSLARPLFWHLLIAWMMLGQIPMLEAFGVDDRVHFLILQCLISTDLAITELK